MQIGIKQVWNYQNQRQTKPIHTDETIIKS